MKILIFQLLDRRRNWSNDAETINRRYAEQHGYEYDAIELDDDLWAGIKGLRHRLARENFDHAIYLEPTAILYPDSVSLETSILPLLGEKEILFATDCGCERWRWTPGRPNGGQFLLRGKGAALEILDQWIESGVMIPAKAHPVLNRALWAIEPKVQKEIAVVEYYRFAARYGYFVRNYYLENDETIASELKRFLDEPQESIRAESVEIAPSEPAAEKPKSKRKRKTATSETVAVPAEEPEPQESICSESEDSV